MTDNTELVEAVELVLACKRIQTGEDKVFKQGSRCDADDAFADFVCNFPTDRLDRIHTALTEAAKEIERLRGALADLASWFTTPTYGVWIIPAGDFGADDAVHAARQALPTGEDG